MFNKIIYVVLLLFQFLCGCFVLAIEAFQMTTKVKNTIKCKFNLGEVIYMTKYREIRLYSLGLSQQSIANNCGASKMLLTRLPVARLLCFTVAM